MEFKPLGDARAHYWKVIAMADAVGVSLVDEWDAGRLTPKAHAGMIDRCRGCKGVAACGRLLDKWPDLQAAPDYCANKSTFAQLKGQKTGR